MKITIFWLEKPTRQLRLLVTLQRRKMGSGIQYHDLLIQLLWYENEWLKTWLPLKKALEPRVMPHGSFFVPNNEANYLLSKKCLIFIIFEKTRQIFVNFFMQSRKRLCKEKLPSRSSTFTFRHKICHLWLLRLSFVAFDLVICGIWAAHLPQVRASKHSSDNPKA